MANVGEVAPDPEDIDAAVKGYEEASTTARLVWERRDDPKMPRRLQRVTTPALVVGAEHDRLVPDEAADALRGGAAGRRARAHPRHRPRPRRRAAGRRRQGHPRLPGACAMNEMQFFHFGLMPYPFIPPGSEIESTWVTLSNAHYDPKVGARLYKEYLDQAVAGGEARLRRRPASTSTTRTPTARCPTRTSWARRSSPGRRAIPVGIIGNALPLHDNPVRVAEEVAMLDVISARAGSSPASCAARAWSTTRAARTRPTRRERFWEAHDLILKAWTDRRPVRLGGQALRPPVREPVAAALPAAASADLAARAPARVETITEAAKRRYPFMMVFAPLSFTKLNYEMYRNAADEAGYEASPEQLGVLRADLRGRDRRASPTPRPASTTCGCSGPG